jgi:hypothetical protein
MANLNLRVRWSMRLVALALAVACAAPSAASAAIRPTKTVKLPTYIDYFSQALPGPNDPGRCVAIAAAIWPNVPGAVSYSVSGTNHHPFAYVVSTSGPPFTKDVYKLGAATFVAPSGAHWLPISSASTGQGCEQAEAGLESLGMYVVSATATLPKNLELISGRMMKGDQGAARERIVIRGPTTTSTRTNGDGTWAETVKKGNYTVTAPPGYCWRELLGNTNRPGMIAACSQVAITKAPGKADFIWPSKTIEGTVRIKSALAPGGREGVPGATVVAIGEGAASSERATATTNQFGQYKLEVPSGVFKVKVTNKTTKFPRELTADVSRHSIVGVDFEICDPLVPRLSDCTAEVKVIVTDLTGDRVEPAHVLVENVGAGLGSHKILGLQGAFDLGEDTWAISLLGVPAVLNPDNVGAPYDPFLEIVTSTAARDKRFFASAYEIPDCVGGDGKVTGERRPVCTFDVDIGRGRPSTPKVEILARLVRVEGTVRNARLPVRVYARTTGNRDLRAVDLDLRRDTGHFEMFIPERLANGIKITAVDRLDKPDERQGRIPACPGGRIETQADGAQACVLRLSASHPRARGIAIDLKRPRR